MQVPVKSLLAELQWTQRFVEGKTSIPILANVLFKADGNRLTLTGTDLEMAGLTYVDGKGKGDWAVAAPVRKLIAYLQKVDEEDVSLSAAGHSLVVSHGDSSSKISGMSQESFPELPKMPAEAFTINGLATAIERTSFAISAEESRFTLNGALLEVTNLMSRMIATDGHRLSIAPVAAEAEATVRALLPKAALVQAGKMDEACRFARDEDHAFFDYGQRQIITRVLKGNFPDYNRVRPAEFANHVMIPVKETLKTLNRVGLYADERSHAVRISINGEGGNGTRLTVFAKTVEQGEASGHVPVTPGEIASPLNDAGFQYTYLADFLSRCTDPHVAFCWKDAKSAAMLTTGDGWEVVIMPMRV